MYDYASAFKICACVEVDGARYPGPSLEEASSVIVAPIPTFTDEDKYWLQLDTPKDVSA
jgi:hypothetical protein